MLIIWNKRESIFGYHWHFCPYSLISHQNIYHDLSRLFIILRETQQHIWVLSVYKLLTAICDLSSSKQENNASSRRGHMKCRSQLNTRKLPDCKVLEGIRRRWIESKECIDTEMFKIIINSIKVRVVSSSSSILWEWELLTFFLSLIINLKNLSMKIQKRLLKHAHISRKKEHAYHHLWYKQIRLTWEFPCWLIIV